MALVPAVGRRGSRRAPGRGGSLGLGAEPEEAIVDALSVACATTPGKCARKPPATLGRLRAGQARDALIASLDDPYWQAGLKSARAVGRLRDPGAGAALGPTAVAFHQQSAQGKRRLRSASSATVVCWRRCKPRKAIPIRKYARPFASRCNRSMDFLYERARTY